MAAGGEEIRDGGCIFVARFLREANSRSRRGDFLHKEFIDIKGKKKGKEEVELSSRYDW
jgi:hypothetical protein